MLDTKAWPKYPADFLFNSVPSGIYDFFVQPMVSMFMPQLMRELKGLDGEVLEIGSGTGLITTQLARLPVKVTAIDPSKHMLEATEAKLKRAGLTNGKINFILGRAEELPVEDERFDAVVMTQILRYIKPESLHLVAGELARVTKPGGKVLIADLRLPLTGAFPNGVGKRDPNYMILGSLAVHSPASLGKYMESYGFTVESINTNPFVFLLVLRKV